MERMRLSAVLTIATVKVSATDKAFVAEQLWQEGLRETADELKACKIDRGHR